MQKRILFLGAGDDQVAAIKYANEAGHYIITCDYLPNNPGHAFADEYHNVNTTDKEAVLALAKELDIDGVLGFGSDVNAPTQAYVANALGLPSTPYASILTLTQKDLFRAFLKENDFYTPLSKSFENLSELLLELESFTFPLMVKPVDSSGSNGVSKVSTYDELKEAFDIAWGFSRTRKVIIEECFQVENHIVDGDGFVVDGELRFFCWGDTIRSKKISALVPIGTTFPAKLSEKRAKYVKQEIERLLRLLNVTNGPFNIEFGFDAEGNFLIIDLGPRNGGSSIPLAIKYATGVDLIKYSVESTLGSDCTELEMKQPVGFFSEYRIHAFEEGVFSHIWYSEVIKKNIVDAFIPIQVGARVEKMNRAADRVGVIYLKFDSNDEMQEKMNNMDKYLKVVLEKVGK